MARKPFTPPAAEETTDGQSYAALSVRYPGLAAFMAERSKSHPDGKYSGGSIILFFEGSELRFCLSPKDGPSVGFGVVCDASDVLGSIELAGQESEIGWKLRSR